MWWQIGRIGSRKSLAAFGGVLVLSAGVACSAASSFVQPNSQVAVSGEAPTAPLSTVSQAKPPSNPAPSNAAGGSAPAPAPAAAARAATSANDATSANAASAPDASGAADSSAQILNRMVIRTAQLSLEVQDMESALSQARAIASRAGGYVSASDTHVEKVNDQDRTVANLTLQVRSDSADSAMSDLRAIGKVTAESSGSQDVTDEYVDLDSNLRNLQASETAILKLMDRATQIQDVLSLQRELTNIRGQIERIQGRKTYLERRTDMATITVGLRLPAPASTQTTVAGWDPIATALRGWQASLTVLRVASDALIVVLAFSWWLIPFIGLGAYLVLHRRRGVTARPPAAPAAGV